jgi:hypothetical protein
MASLYRQIAVQLSILNISLGRLKMTVEEAPFFKHKIHYAWVILYRTTGNGNCRSVSDPIHDIQYSTSVGDQFDKLLLVRTTE